MTIGRDGALLHKIFDDSPKVTENNNWRCLECLSEECIEVPNGIFFYGSLKSVKSNV